ncbi:COR domain-containing protein [Streptomyces sp. SAS_270]|uniref:COR domain-containing protein n=1 Tax=Streptomyces sp. SAS_270 TaxID=3412748 RepID=UPI00403CEACB
MPQRYEEDVQQRIAEARSTKNLDLSSVQLTEVPGELADLTHLTHLSLRGNSLTALPEWLGNLTELTNLDLMVNPLDELPGWIGNLVNLTDLELNASQLTSLPESIGNLTRLTALFLNENKLTGLPSSFGNLTSLELLNLSGTGLTSLPDSMGNLTKLNYLVLKNNRLTDLPDSLGYLTNLSYVDLEGNELSDIPPEVVAAGTETLLAFLRERSASRTTRQWSSKVVFVGEGRAGKTSLIKSLLDEPFESNESSTHGLNVINLDLPHPSADHADVVMRLSTWDFGGQEIYHATHQFFLTDRSLFVLVWDAQIGWESTKLYYWLDMIKARAPRAPVILVATHLGPRPADLPLADLHAAYPGVVVASMEADNETRQGVAAVRDRIAEEAARLPLMGVIWPEAWLNAAEAVRADPRNHVAPHEMAALLSERGVTDPGHQRGLTDALHSLGDVLAYSDDPELGDMVVLRPQWVTDYISRVLDAPAVRQTDALFTKAHQSELWHDLSANLRRHFVALMERFDLSYRTDDGTSSIVVELLPWDPPAYEEAWAAAESAHRELRLRYRLHTVPPGIPTWFIAREHRFTAGLHWRSGALLRHPDGEHTALVTVDRIAKTAELRVRGPYPQDFLAILKDGFEQTLRRYPGLEINRTVPCPGTLPDGAECTHEFPHDQLKARLARTPPREEVECPVEISDHNVRQLMQGIEPPGALRSEELLTETRDAVRRMTNVVERQRQDGAVQHDDMLRALEQMEARQASIAAEQQRAALAAWRGHQTSQQVTCPSVVSVSRVTRRRALGMVRGSCFQLRLYCEAPGQWHPAPGHEPYEVRATSQLEATLLPYARGLFKILRYAVPVVGGVIGVASDDLDKVLKDDIKLMKALLDTTSELAEPDDPADIASMNTLVKAQWDAEFRAMRALLEQLDPHGRWGGLNKILTPEGDTLWLCEDHARPYRNALPAAPTPVPGQLPPVS